MTLKCPYCGNAITALLGATPDAIPAAISTPNGKIAQMVLGSKPLTKDGRQPYNQDYPEEFEVFWKIYPIRKDKRKAFKAWRNAIRRAAISDINEGAIRYRNDPNRTEEFSKYAEGWLNGDRWLDDALPARSNGKPPDPSRPYDPALAEIEIERARHG